MAERLPAVYAVEEGSLLRQENLGQVFMGEHELALAMARAVVEHREAVEVAERSGTAVGY